MFNPAKLHDFNDSLSLRLVSFGGSMLNDLLFSLTFYPHQYLQASEINYSMSCLNSFGLEGK